MGPILNRYRPRLFWRSAKKFGSAGERKFYDLIPALLEKKYLKTMYRRHECANTLGGGDTDGDGEITVLDVDHILHGGNAGMNWA